MKKEEERKKENREDNEESLPGKKFYTSKITEMATLTDAVPRCGYFHLDLSLRRAKPCLLFSLW